MGLPPRRKDKKVERGINIGLDIYGKENAIGNNLLPAEKKVSGNNLLPLESEVKGNNLLPPKKDEIDLGLSELKNLVNSMESFILTDEKELNDFLGIKSIELLKIQAKAVLQLGRIFIEVEEKLGGDNQHNGVYTKWLELNGFNKMTALRHKRRYRLFTQVTTDLGKSLVGTLPQNIINEIVMKSEEEIKEYIVLIDEGIKKEELAQIIQKEEIKSLEVNEIEKAEIESEYNLLNDMLHKISIESLDTMEKISFEKDMKRVEKILKKYVRG